MIIAILPAIRGNHWIELITNNGLTANIWGTYEVQKSVQGYMVSIFTHNSKIPDAFLHVNKLKLKFVEKVKAKALA